MNLHSAFYLAKAIAPGMIERGKGGCIIALTGNSALTADSPESGAQSASRDGLHGFVKALAQALGPHGIRANLLTISNIESEGRTPEWYAEAAKRTAKFPLKRMGKQDEVANAALFLASDESSYITGDRLVCEGGLYIRELDRCPAYPHCQFAYYRWVTFHSAHLAQRTGDDRPRKCETGY